MDKKKPPGLIEQLMWPLGQKPGTPKLDSFGNPRTNPFDAVIPMDRAQAHSQKERYDNPTVTVPARHLAAPEGAETVDIRRLSLTIPGDNFNIIEFTCPQGATTVFYKYVLFTDAVVASTILFEPTLDNKRILAYHGDPQNNYVINLAVGIDLADQSSIPCQIFMYPGQVLRWRVENNATNPLSMGVRMIGYLDYGQRLTSSKLGG